jgi:hypothetical protein
MDKSYKKFYEIGNNRYYTLTADQELYIATESFIKVAPRFSFLKPKTLTQGLKLLKLTAPIAILFGLVANAELDGKRNKKDTAEELLKYKKVKHSVVRDLIKAAYMDTIELQKEELNEWLKVMRTKVEEKISDKKGAVNAKEFEDRMQVFYNRYDNALNVIEKNNPLGKTVILDDSQATAFTKLKFVKVKHLYTEKVTNLVENKYFYELDAFGTLTIYRMITVKNVIKTIDTFIYDRKLLKELLKII